MKALILGGSGFLGLKIVQRLAEYYEVYVFSRKKQLPDFLKYKKIYLIQGNLLQCDEIDFSQFDLIINASGELLNENVMKELHVEVLKKILERINNATTHWIQLSSVGVYGRPKKGMITENSPFFPKGTYEITKAEGEDVVQTYCKKNNIKFTILRPSNVFGLGMSNKSLEKLIGAIQKGTFMRFGNPEQIIMNYVEVDDVVEAIACIANNDKSWGKSYIISDYVTLQGFLKIVNEEFNSFKKVRYVPLSLAQFIAKIMEVAFPQFPLTLSRVNALTSKAIFSSEKITTDLGFQFKIGLDDGLRNYCRQLHFK